MSLQCLSVGVLVVDHLCDPIARMPEPGELVVSTRLPLAIGGCAANVAVCLARLGVEVGVVGCVGRDHFGPFLLERLGAANVDTRDVRQLEGVETAGTFVLNVQGQDRRFIHAAGANGRLTAGDIPLDRACAAKVLYVGGYLMLESLDAAALAEVFRRVRAAGVKTVLDVVLPDDGNHWQQLEPLLHETDVFLPNEDEGRLLTGISDAVAQAERFHAAGARTVVVTRGSEGAVLVSPDRRLAAAAYRLEYAGSTGAGDAFDAGYIAGLLANEDEEGCLRWATALGASCVRSLSATESVFTRREAEAFMRDQPLRVAAL